MFTKAQYHNKLKSLAEDNHLIGMSVIIVQKGKIKDIFHYGKSNIERNIQVNDNTLFRIASISKAITSVALMKLYEIGKFNLDDDISPYLGYKVINPNFPEKKITFRMLLTHTSSLLDGDTYDDFLMASYKQNPPPNLKELLTEGGSHYQTGIWKNTEPGRFFSYSNLNYGIIGTLIEKLSSQHFDVFVRKEILYPMGISGSFNVCDIENVNNISTLYRNSLAQVDDYKGITPKVKVLSTYKIGDNGIIHSPAGGLRISAVDLGKFMIMLMNFGEYNGCRILDSTTVQLMCGSQWKFNGFNGDNSNNLFNEWGLGFHIVTGTKNKDCIFNGETMIGHTGDAYGLISCMFFNEQRDFGFVFITNGYSGGKGYANSGKNAFYKPESEAFEVIEEYWCKKYLGTTKKMKIIKQN